MKNPFLLLILLIFVATPLISAHAASLNAEFSALVKKERILLPRQAACVEGPSGVLLSRNPTLRIIPASVSKLYVFDWALSTLQKDFRYSTTFIRNGRTLYINGGGDPHFVVEHLRLALAKVKADSDQPITKIVIAGKFFYNWKSSETDILTTLRTSLSSDTDLLLAKDAQVTFSSSSYKGKGTKYEFRSIPLPALIKQINNYSTNISTDTLFQKLGGPDAFALYMQKTYGVGSETIRFETGSGLSGNYTTCELTLRVIKHLEHRLKEQNLSLTDILTVPTVDPGVLEKRAIDLSDAKSLVAKSGFLNHHHTLASVINTKDGSIYYAVFTDFDSMNKSTAVKAMVDKFTSIVLKEHRKILVPFFYTPDTTIFEKYEVIKQAR